MAGKADVMKMLGVGDKKAKKKGKKKRDSLELG